MSITSMLYRALLTIILLMTIVRVLATEDPAGQYTPAACRQPLLGLLTC